MAEEKKEFQFVTEVPKNVWGPEFEDIFVYPMYDDSKVAMEITVAEGVSKIAWEVIDNGSIIASGSADAPEAGARYTDRPAAAWRCSRTLPSRAAPP